MVLDPSAQRKETREALAPELGSCAFWIRSYSTASPYVPNDCTGTSRNNSLVNAMLNIEMVRQSAGGVKVQYMGLVHFIEQIQSAVNT